jgi:hypothetical protein
MVAPLEGTWSEPSFYVNRIYRPWSRPEMLTGSWDTLYLGIKSVQLRSRATAF